MPALTDDLDPGVAARGDPPQRLAYLQKLPPDRIVGEATAAIYRSRGYATRSWLLKSCSIVGAAGSVGREIEARFDLIPSTGDAE